MKLNVDLPPATEHVLETVNYENEMTDKMYQIEADESKSQKEKRIAMCEVVLAKIGNMQGKDLEPHLTKVSIDTLDGGLIIDLKFLPN